MNLHPQLTLSGNLLWGGAWRIFRLVLVAAFANFATAALWQEDFTNDPLANGWHVVGDDSLFRWDSTSHALSVTWDSSHTNSHFLRSLDAVLTKADDFNIGCTLRLSDVVVGVNSNKPFTFQIAVGLLRLANVTYTNLWRGSGVNANHGPRNLAEFAWFPDSGFGATVSPTLVSSNNQFASGFDFPLELDPGATFHVAMHYTASNQTLRTTMTRNGAPFGLIKDVKLGASFTDFRLDHFAVSSYSDTGADGSILAHGTVDNITVSVPTPAITFPGVASPIGLSNGIWTITLLSQTGVAYELERTTNLTDWHSVAGPLPGTGGLLLLPDNSPPVDAALYRVKADRP